MRLLFVLPEYFPHTGGGIATFYQHLLPELVRQGHTVRVIVGSAFTSKLPAYEADGVSVEFLDDRAVSANLNKFDRYCAIPELQRHLAAAWTLWEQADKGASYDLVETTDWGLLFVPWVVESNSPPLVVQLHASIGQIDFYDPKAGDELQGSMIRILEAQLLGLAEEVQTYSRANAASWSELIGREVTYCPPAWTAANVTPEKAKISANGLVVGRVQYWKGPTVLCEALRLLGSSAPAIDWVGRDSSYGEVGGSMSAYLTQNYSEIWGTKLRSLGSLPPLETAKAQAGASFAIVPSIWDVFNYTCIEAMGYSRVVLCSDGAGASSSIDDGINGLVFEKNNPKSLAEKIDYFNNMSASAREEMGRKARETVTTLLAPDRIASQRIAAYERAIAKGKFGASAHSWLVDAVCPQSSLKEPLAFLDNLPLKTISKYILRRSLQKIGRKL